MTKSYIKRLKKYPSHFQFKFIDIISRIESWDFSDLDITTIQWEKDCYRCRVWKFRILFHKDSLEKYIINDIGSRWDIYK